ncbi:hypothetical protein EMIHUDRAFT_64876 [Emiliania huxleyi CCMP1516]|uniref:V-type proton ATPase subunit a n=2 Tax=Emiliania huxleyi TaxID=2903 RepID=A0A0D3JM18_EMIH1|nr:hypothetical protein EMIHUDRAFT_64876 [Emiliania huxleyi CCMP1516]EOD24553.1 hypothetical protein EMIHUDRAFT_64876 [Emiliania huxleyi CCMP1516]|eukprot:XP_005776982.1 hypothetical protein EMIHUDRAFT_64876 [Emiliania huxleyi CCMP1516]
MASLCPKGELWRSKKMQLVQLIVQNDAAHAVMSHLGELGKMQMRDLNAGTSFYKRSFVDEVRECDELGRILRSIGDELDAAGIKPAQTRVDVLELPELGKVDTQLREVEVELESLKASQALFEKNHNALEEQAIVLAMGKNFYNTGEGALASRELEADNELLSLSEFGAPSRWRGHRPSPAPPPPLTGPPRALSSMLGVVAGVVKTEFVASLERILFRATRGNCVFQQKRIKKLLLDAGTAKDGPELTQKSFFMVFFTGGVLGDKVSKIATYFGATLYKYPDLPGEHARMVVEVDRRLTESSEVLARSTAILNNALQRCAHDYALWTHVVGREKMVYDALNKCEFDIKRHVFIAEGWVCTDEYEMIHAELQRAAISRGLDTRPIMNQLRSRLTPPTYVPTNSFTSGFQALVNTYGTPRYREVNPGAFCCILFPYLFGIMFGDFGHGLLFALFGLYLISKEKEWEGKDLGDMLEMVYGGRYICFLNGVFGAFVGLLYNEAFAFPMGFFGTSRWLGPGGETCANGEDCELSPELGIYPVGIDPIWHVTENKITFFNSLKMKISIVVGVLQMSLGVFLSLLNHLEYKDYKKVVFQFIPEIVFFEGIFGYLVLTIFYKWATDCGPDGSTVGSYVDKLGPNAGQLKVCISPMQSSIQGTLLIAAFCAVPVLLLAIPFIEIYQHSGKRGNQSYANLDDDTDGAQPAPAGEEHHEFSAGDAFIHQGIHTIEFVLGGISNTASYLRLWALSLAHSQLAELFKDMILGSGLKSRIENPYLAAFVLFIAFSMWAIISLVVLMAMENLSSFLHALRLQWVEFQNKFYYGDGQKFSPFTFAAIGQAEE